MAMRPSTWIAVTLGLFLTSAAASGQLENSFFDQLDHPAIQYSSRPSRDLVAELNRKLQNGELTLQFDGDQGYLKAVLKALQIPIESQMVVFSKTSVQAHLINPQNPRTIFFNDSVAVGWMHGGFIELASHDPQQGVMFYALAQQETETPTFTRVDGCLQCHYSYATLGVPGLLVRSIPTRLDGTTMPFLGNYTSDHRSAFSERWGGWYVTGKANGLRHMGNLLTADTGDPSRQSSPLDSLKDIFQTERYLSPYSDIVALMVFEHQAHMINLLTRIGWETRRSIAEERRDQATLLGNAARELVDYLFFVDEARLTGDITGTSGFAEQFAAQGPSDSKGRSLRQLDLRRRLMRYPCSYMIYSAAFEELPSEAREAIYARMWQVLSGNEADTKYAGLSLPVRQTIVEILRDTKKGLPAYFQTLSR